MGNRRETLLVAILLATCSCTLPPLQTPTPRPTPTPSPVPIPTPSASPTPSPSPTPLLGAVPGFSAPEVIATRIDGLRVRQRPSTSSTIVTGLLPLDARLEVVMGPIVVDEVGWYLVTDADAGDPSFEEGWVAAGREPEAFLAPTGEVNPGSPSLASLAQTGDAEYGPVEIGDGDHAIRWVALDPDRVRCTFAVSLAAGSAAPVPAIRATIGNDVVPGTLQPGSFAALDVRGQVFVSVTSDCAWTLVVQRVVAPSPSPAAS